MGVLAEPITALADGFDSFVTNVGDFFGNLTTSLGNWFTDLNEDLQDMSTNIGNWFEGIGDKIQGFAEDVSGFFNDLTLTIVNWFTDLNEDLQDMSTNIGNWFEELSDNIGNWFEELSDNVDESIEELGNKLTIIMSYLNPLSDNFFLKIAFIPSQEFIEMNNERMASLGEQKFGFIEDFKSVFEDLKDNLNVGSNVPNFSLTLPSKWGGGTVNIINFEAYDSIRLLVKNIIRIFIWLYFIFRMYKRIPKIIY